jgi:hypothetical protein
MIMTMTSLGKTIETIKILEGELRLVMRVELCASATGEFLMMDL